MSVTNGNNSNDGEESIMAKISSLSCYVRAVDPMRFSQRLRWDLNPVFKYRIPFLISDKQPMLQAVFTMIST
jgi:hypothetical protein